MDDDLPEEATESHPDSVRLVGLHRLVSATMRGLAQAGQASIDPILNSALAAIGTFSGVDRSYIFLIDDDGEHLSNTHEWCAAGIAPEIANLQHVPKSVADVWMEEFAADRHVYVADVAALGDEDEDLRDILLAQDIRSLLVAPLGSGSDTHGFIGFDYVRHRAEFSPADLDVLRILADTIGAALRRIRAEDRARRVELTDRLTGLPNRTMFMELVEQSLENGTRRVPLDDRNPADRRNILGDPRTLIGLLDIDRFADVNETLGFDTGDTILREIATRLKAALRPDDHVARIGADEFAFLVDDAGDDAAIDAISSRIAAAISEPIQLDRQVATMSASVGFNVGDSSMLSATDLISGAEAALRQAQGAGGGRAVSFDRASGDRIAERVNLTMRLRSPNGLDDLWVAYQPAVEFTTGLVLGIEALARYVDADGTPIPPDVFVPVAEESRMITPLTQRVIEIVLDDVYGRIRPLLDLPLSVSINTSPVHLREPTFLSELEAYCTSADSEPVRLWIELTESGALVGDPQVTANLAAVAETGVRLAIDDFGTGYSSFSRLRHLPVHGLKVDQSFIRGIDSDPVNRALVRAQVDIAEQLDLLLLAEGCETDAEIATLVELGVQFGQGFGLHRPMPIDDLVKLFELQRSRST